MELNKSRSRPFRAGGVRETENVVVRRKRAQHCFALPRAVMRAGRVSAELASASLALFFYRRIVQTEVVCCPLA